MRKYLLIIFTLVFACTVQSQTFTGTGGAIPDAGYQTCFPIDVSGVGVIDASYGLAGVCLSINHTFDADLEIALKAPDGTEVQLSISNGGTGANYTGTCFTATASVPISSGTAPFTGVFLPEGYLGNVNNGQNADGTWLLCIRDVVPSDIGSLQSWDLTFNSSPAAPPASCSGNPPAGDTWSTATPICNFYGFCGNTSSAYAKDTWPELTSAFCGNIDNNSFVSFIASSSAASFNVWVNNSLNGLGIQMFFFSNSSGSGPVISHGCYNQVFPSSGGPTLVTASGLVPGNKYYLMIDGKDGDVCDYTIAAATGVNILSITPVSPGVCPGKSIGLTVSGGNGSFTWSPASGLNRTTGATVLSTPDSTTLYTVTSGGGSIGACPLTAQVIVTVYEKPDLGPDKTQGLCMGSSIDLTDKFNTAGLTTSWTKSGVPVPPPDNINTTGTYGLIAVNTYGCSDTASITVNFISKPSLGADKSLPVCKDGTADLTTSYNTTNLETDWTFAGLPVSYPEAASVPGNYRLIVSGGTNCYDTAFVNLVSYSAPVLGSDKAISICPGLTIDLTSLYNTAGLTTEWTNGGIPVTAPNAVSSAGDYQLLAYSNSVCADTALVKISVNPLLDIGPDTTINICQGDTVSLTGLYITGAFTTEWTLNNAIVSPPVAEANSGLYRLVAFNGFSCTDTAYVTLSVNSNPSIGNDKIVAVCTGLSFDLSNQFNTNGLNTYWAIGGTAIANPASVTSEGIYQVIAKNSFGCSDTAVIELIETGKPNLGADKSVNICNGVAFNLNTQFSLTALTPNWTLNGIQVANSAAVTTPGVYRLIAYSTPGCADTAFLTISTIAKLDLGLDKIQASCEGNFVDLTTLYSTFNLNTVWTSGGLPVPDPGAVNTPGTYQLIATDGATCFDTALVVIDVKSKPVIGADKTIEICFGDSADLSAQYITTGLMSLWAGSVPVINPSAVANSGVYRLVAIDNFGCSDTAWVTLQVNETPALGSNRTVTFCSGFAVDLNSAFSNTGFTNIWTESGTPVANPSSVTTAGNYKLVSVTSKGCTDSVQLAINFSGILDLGPDKNALLCPGSTLDLTKQFTTGALNTSWTLAGVPVSTPNAIAVPGSYMLTADNGFGCSDIAFVNVSLSVKPDLGSDEQVNICQGKSVNLLSLFSLSGLYTTWTKAGVPVPVPVSVSVADTYGLIAKNSNGCSDTVFMNVIVNANPVLGDDVVKIACPWEVVDLTHEYNTGAFTSLWTLNNSIVPDPSAVSKIGNYRLVVTDAIGCSDTAVVALLAGSKPDLGLDRGVGICAGSARNITKFYPKYTTNDWYFQGMQIPEPISVSVPGYYELRVSNSYGCKDTALVTARLMPKPDIGADKNINICPGSSVGLNAQYNLSGYTVSWTLNGAAVPNPNAVTTDGAYILIVKNSNSCVDTAVVNVAVKTKPVLGIDKKVTACEGSKYDLTVLYNTTDLTSNWTLNSVPVVAPSAIEHTGTYQLISTNSSACSDTAYVTLAHNPKPAIGQDSFIAICPGQAIDLEIVYDTAGLTTSWELAGLPVLNPSATGAAGDYQLIATNNFLCTDTAMVNVFVKSTTYSTSYDTICSNQVPYVWNGSNYSVSGVYSITLVNAAGCDSVATLELIVHSTSSSTTALTICSNELPYLWNGISCLAEGMYTATLVNAVGCDSVAVLQLTVNAASSSVTEITICEDFLPYSWNRNTYTGEGDYKVVLTNAVNCDSVAFLKLQVNKKGFSTTPVTICSNQLPYSWNGNSYSSAGLYDVILLNTVGCDSIATLKLTVNATSTSTTQIAICNNQLPYLWNGNNYSSAGIYNVVLVNAVGCDSVATLELTVNSTSASVTQVIICSNELPYQWNSNSYSSAGTYTVLLNNAANCDSVATLELTVNSISTSKTEITICSNQLPYSWNGNNYSSAGSYNVVLTNAVGCDSIATLELSVNPASASTALVTICSNQLPYTWNGNSYAAAGTYSVTLTNALNCDSVATLDLTVNAVSSSTTNTTICSNYLPYQWNGNSYSSAGTYSVLLTNAANCDSVATLILNVTQISVSTTRVTICNNKLPYSWNGKNYSSAGSYTFILTNAAGCDSVATLELTTNLTTSSTTNTSICEANLPYRWNGNSYSSAGTYTVVLVNAAGCDSIATLVLTVNKATLSTTNINICSRKFPYQWNNNAYTLPGIYTVTLQNQFGCDSTATLILTEKQTDTSTTNFSICRAQLPYQWNGNSYSSAGIYTANLLTNSGCDSVAVLILTVNEANSSITDVSICSGYLPYHWNGLLLNGAGSYKATLINQYGCDSVANLNLEVNISTSSSESKTICHTDLPFTWRGVEYPFAGTYSETFVNAVGCDSVASFTLIVKQMPAKPVLGEDAVICRNDKFVLTPGSYGNYLWQDNSTGPVFDVQNTGTYSVKVWEDTNCVSADSIYVQVLENCGELFYPTAFTPNGDGLNDAFGAGPKEYTLLVKNYSFQVFNRYGAIVFSTEDPNKKWDGTYQGKKMDPGTFAWSARYLYKNKLWRAQKGFVVLLR